MPTTPVISNLTLHGLPQLIRQELGERTLARAVHAAGIDLEMIEGESCFIPHAAALRLIDTAARIAGEANFGLLMAPQMDVANYGSMPRIRSVRRSDGQSKLSHTTPRRYDGPCHPW